MPITASYGFVEDVVSMENKVASVGSLNSDQSDIKEDSDLGIFWIWGALSIGVLAFLYFNRDLVNENPYLALLVLPVIGFIGMIKIMMLGAVLGALGFCFQWAGKVFNLEDEEIWMRVRWVLGTVFVVGILQAYFSR